MQSVLQDWVMELPLRYQGTLLTCIRGCDLVPKLPLDSMERRITSYIRHKVMVAVDPREIDSEPGCFMTSEFPADFKPSQLGHYPHHWVMHIMHGLEIIAAEYPTTKVRREAGEAYSKLVRSMHLNPETCEQMGDRLTEDRIAKNNIVGD